MKPKNLQPNSNATPLDIIARIMKLRLTSVVMRLGVILLLAGLVAGSSYLNSASSNAAKPALDKQSAVAGNPDSTSLVSTTLGGSPTIRTINLFPLLPPPPAAPTVTTYASDCTTPKTVFNLQDADKTVCAKVTGANPSWRILWSNSNFITVQNVPVGSGTNTFTLTAASSLGEWRVILYDPNGGTVQALTRFTVIDANNPKADVSVSKGLISGSLSAGGQVVFAVQVDNAGPDAAASVTLSDAIPGNTEFVSFDQLSGPVFTCTSPTAAATSGSTSCTISSFARGASATFVATYKIGLGVSSGTVISNTASASSITPDPSADNNSATAEGTVVGSPCQISSPANVTVNSASGEAGAVVTYSTPSYSGDCGQPTTGEGGETVPVISCNPASGTFFSNGTTTVICVAQTGDAATFQVTVNNPGGGLSISLNGASTMAAECGIAFGDPGATAIDGTGQTLPDCATFPEGTDFTNPANACWQVTIPGTFAADAPATGSYVLTYTATKGTNSVSTTRTVNVSDTKAPTITVNGANPYRIATGSCSPFVDPGATANDSCAGAKPVTSSTSGPGGATSVNTAVAGTYTVTYTATDGTYSTTATRTVLVGTFPIDEVDQPPTSDVRPTITLIGDDQISIECGTPFTDPGATAEVCGNSIAVTTTGSVDIHAPGVYSITYSATANGFTTTATRTVTVEADNTAPTITLNGANPMTVECHTSFTDPGAIAHDACAGDFPATASGSVNPNVVGTYTLTYNATDPTGHAATAVTRTVNVVDTTNPVVTAPANVTVNTGSGNTSCTVVVSDATLGTASANDSCQGSLSTTRSGVPAGNVFPGGTTTITYTATDASGNVGTATQTVTVIDNTAPTITTNGQTLSMWPPNHKYQTFQVTQFVTGASDNCDSSVNLNSVVIEKVTSDEIENGNGDGNTTNDIVIAANCKSVQLRSEREGDGNGRVYTITFRVRDSSGNTTNVTAKVVVQHNPGETAVDSGVHYTVTSACP